MRAHRPWYWRWLMLAGVAAAIVGASWGTYHFGSEFAGFRKSAIEAEMKRLNELTAKQADELAELRTKLAAADARHKIELGSYGDIARQLKQLADENATLKDDLAFFQTLTAGRDEAIAVGRLKVEPDTVPGEFRYRLLLVQGGQRPNDFQGHVQLVVSAQRGSEKIVLSLPQIADGKKAEYQLNFKSFQRVEGTFKIAPEAAVKSVQVRVYQNGTSAPKLTRSLNIS